MSERVCTEAALAGRSRERFTGAEALVPGNPNAALKRRSSTSLHAAFPRQPSMLSTSSLDALACQRSQLFHVNASLLF